MRGRVLASFYGVSRASKTMVDSVVLLQLVVVGLCLGTLQAQTSTFNDTTVIALGMPARFALCSTCSVLSIDMPDLAKLACSLDWPNNATVVWIVYAVAITPASCGEKKVQYGHSRATLLRGVLSCTS